MNQTIRKQGAYMMRQHVLKFFVGAVAGVVAVCQAPQARAGFVGDLEAVQSANSSLLHQWKFEGGDDSTRLLDSGPGGLNLAKIAGSGGAGTVDPDGVPDNGDEYMYDYPAGDVNMIGFEAGFDGAGVSQAYRPQSIAVTSTNAAEQLSQTRSGAGLYGAGFSTPKKLTVEAVVEVDAYDSLRTVHYIAQTRPANDRGYFLAQQLPSSSRNGQGNLVGVVGTAFGNRPAIVQDYQAGHYYYVAASFDMSATPTATANAYYKDLTLGGPLVQSLTNHAFTFDGSLTSNSGPLGVGLFAIGNPVTGAQEILRGAIDNLTMYSNVLSAAEVERHSRGVPEPASLVLLTLSSLALGLVRRRSA